MVSGFHDHYLVAWPGGRVAVGATRETGSGFDPRSTAAGVREVLDEALRLAPGLAAATLLEVRVGLRPLAADGLPILGPVPGCAGLVARDRSRTRRAHAGAAERKAGGGGGAGRRVASVARARSAWIGSIASQGAGKLRPYTPIRDRVRCRGAACLLPLPAPLPTSPIPRSRSRDRGCGSRGHPPRSPASTCGPRRARCAPAPGTRRPPSPPPRRPARW